MKHTAGTWWVSSNLAEDTKERVFDLMADDKPLGRLWGDNAVWLGEGEDEANARLIAAAPDLLAACKAALFLIENSSFVDSEVAGAEEAARQLKAAIAKGEQ